MKHKRFYHVSPTSNYTHKINHRSMDNIWSLFKVCYKQNTRTVFLWLILNRFHISFGGSNYWLGRYLFNETVQLISTKIFNVFMYLSFIYILKYYKEPDTASETFFIKGLLEIIVKILDKYSCKEFLKIPFRTWISSQIFSKNFNHNYYNNSLKYAANKTLFPYQLSQWAQKLEIF